MNQNMMSSKSNIKSIAEDLLSNTLVDATVMVVLYKSAYIKLKSGSANTNTSTQHRVSH